MNDIELLENLFNELNKHNVDYLVLRGNLTLMEMAQSKDIDILVAKSHKDIFESIIRDFGWSKRRYQGGKYPHLFFDINSSSNRLVVTLDVVDDLVFGTEIYRLNKQEIIFKSSKIINGVKVPNSWVALFLFILHISFDKKKLKGHNIRRAKEMWNVCLDQLDEQKVLSDSYSERACDIVKLFGQSIDSIDFEVLIDLVKKEILLLNVLKRQKLKAIFDKWIIITKMVCFRPLRVVVLGVDGSGKSTLVSMLAKNNEAHIGTEYLGCGKFYTRFANTLLRLQKETRGRSLSHFIVTILLMIWIPIEIKSRVVKAEFGRNIVVFDRHPKYEVRSKNAILRIWSFIVGYIVPKPDILILCDGDAKVIWERKREVTFEEHMKYKNQLLESFRKSKVEKYIINTDYYDVNQCYELIINIIRNSNIRRNLLYRDSEYLLIKKKIY